ncbi:hypothetical protein D3C77_692600 [compost metagenome]
MVTHLQPEQTPCPGHDTPDVISSTAYCDPSSVAIRMSKTVENSRHLVIYRHTALHMGKRIQCMCITAMLANDKVRLEMLG